MRDILFKAKRIDNGEWVEGYLFVIGEKVYIICQAEVMCTDNENADLYATEWYEVDKNTICQDTGLVDTNGKKIWENDILRKKDVMGNVIFEEGSFLYCWKRFYKYSGDFFKKCILKSFASFLELEVIGNIFDNAELLEG